jgi:sugar (pentulose or hexulose) kinase
VRGHRAGLYAGLTDLEGELRKRAASFEPQPAAVAAYDERYERWLQLYPRMLALSEDGLVNPLWRAAGAARRPHPDR